MVDARRPEPDLRHLKTVAFFAEQVFARGYGTLSKVSSPIGAVWSSQPIQRSRPDQPDAWRIHRHDNAGMAAGAVGVRIGDRITIRNEQRGCAAAGDEPFAAR